MTSFGINVDKSKAKGKASNQKPITSGFARSIYSDKIKRSEIRQKNYSGISSDRLEFFERKKISIFKRIFG